MAQSKIDQRNITFVMKDKKFLILSSAFFLLFIIGMLSLTLDKPTSQILRASNAVPSPLKSFVIVYPQTTQAREGKIKVTVYLRDASSNVLPNRNILLASSPNNIDITPSQTLNTDNLGMAQFMISSKNPGKVVILATDAASGTTISNTPSVEFTP